MTAIKTFEQLSFDIEKTLTALLNVRTIEDIHNARKMPGYVYNQDKEMREYWIALGQYSFSADLSLLAFVVNGREQLLPNKFNSKQDLVNFYQLFKNNKNSVIDSFKKVIGKPNMVFIGYAEPITMEQYLQKVVSDIHIESMNLDYNYKHLLTNQGIDIHN